MRWIAALAQFPSLAPIAAALRAGDYATAVEQILALPWGPQEGTHGRVRISDRSRYVGSASRSRYLIIDGREVCEAEWSGGLYLQTDHSAELRRLERRARTHARQQKRDAARADVLRALRALRAGVPCAYYEGQEGGVMVAPNGSTASARGILATLGYLGEGPTFNGQRWAMPRPAGRLRGGVFVEAVM